MRALKCDICGKLFEARMCLPVITIQIDEGYYGQRRLDLCDDCQQKLEAFVNLKGDDKKC